MAENIDWAGGGTRAKSILTRCTASCAVAVRREGEDLGLSLIHGRVPLRLPPAERLGRCEQGSFSEAATGAAAVGAGRRTECEERGGSRGRATREAEGRQAGGLHRGEGRSSGVSVIGVPRTFRFQMRQFGREGGLEFSVCIYGRLS